VGRPVTSGAVASPPGSAPVEPRVPCTACGKPILDGARKCRHCKQWQAARGSQRLRRAAIIVTSAVATVVSVIATSGKSTVGEAPPLTPLPGESADASASGEPAPASVGADRRARPLPPPPPAARRAWKAKDIVLGDIHPLDVAFAADGESIFVSGDDASLREIEVPSGETVHKASTPAQGDRIRLLFGRYVALLRQSAEVGVIPVMDTTKWDRDPISLPVGPGPGDVVELPDGSIVASTTHGRRVRRFGLPSGRLLGDVTLPQATGHLFLVRAEGRPYVAALGALTQSGRPAGAWIDLFDPAETPFGATRRSIAVGREPRRGAVTEDGSAIFFADRLSHTAHLLDVARQTTEREVRVGQDPQQAFLLRADRWGVTIDSASRTATVVDLDTWQTTALALAGVPRSGVATADRTTIFVALGGTEWPPRGRGLAIIADEPPRVVATLPTGEGAHAVAVSPDGRRAVVANFRAKSLTLVE
jgi:predicted nucleic acid-binding Zn ribbon protein